METLTIRYVYWTLAALPSQVNSDDVKLLLRQLDTQDLKEAAQKLEKAYADVHSHFQAAYGLENLDQFPKAMFKTQSAGTALGWIEHSRGATPLSQSLTESDEALLAKLEAAQHEYEEQRAMTYVRLSRSQIAAKWYLLLS